VIVVAGEALIDLVVTAEQIVATPGGAPYNVARGCARLGMETALMATLSTDGFGQRLAAGLAESGVSTSLVQPTDRPTTLAVAEVDARGGARYRFYADGTSAPLLTPTALPDTADALVTGGLGLVLEPMAAAIEHVVAQASADVLVLVDLNCRPAAIDDRVAYIARLRHVLARADVIKASDEDVEWLMANGAELLGSDKRVVLVTAGDAGTTIRTSAGSVEVAVEAVPVVDTIGAGDAFTAGFVSWWSASGRGRGDLGDATAIEQAVRAAHEVAAVVVSRRGADPPRREDLPLDWL
jgi:fructokinase